MRLLPKAGTFRFLGARIPAETLRRFWNMLAHQQVALINAAQLAPALATDGKTVARYLDLLVDLLLVRRMPAFHANTGKRLVKSPKVFVCDGGLVHSLLQLDAPGAFLGHPVAGSSWEGFVVENLLRAAPERAAASFYQTTAGAEMDLVLDLPGRRRFAIEVKRGLAPQLTQGFYRACEDLAPTRVYVVHGDDERLPKAADVEAIRLGELCAELSVLRQKHEN